MKNIDQFSLTNCVLSTCQDPEYILGVERGISPDFPLGMLKPGLSLWSAWRNVLKALKFQAPRICSIRDNQTGNNYAKQNQVFLRCLTLIMNEGKVKPNQTKPTTVNLTF